VIAFYFETAQLPVCDDLPIPYYSGLGHRSTKFLSRLGNTSEDDDACFTKSAG
jgi:hypothetical protein